MPAWMIITAKIHDRERFVSEYGQAAGKLAAQFGGSYIIRGPGAQQLEGSGDEGASIAVSEWPDKAAALRFWNSPEYAEVKKLREGLAEVSVLLIGSEGLCA